MPDMNAPAERESTTREKPAEVNLEQAGRYQPQNPASLETVADQSESSVANRYQQKAAPTLEPAAPTVEPAVGDAINRDAPTTRGRSRAVSEPAAERQKDPETLDPQRQRSASAPADRALETPPPPAPPTPRAPAPPPIDPAPVAAAPVAAPAPAPA